MLSCGVELELNFTSHSTSSVGLKFISWRGLLLGCDSVSGTVHETHTGEPGHTRCTHGILPHAHANPVNPSKRTSTVSRTRKRHSDCVALTSIHDVRSHHHIHASSRGRGQQTMHVLPRLTRHGWRPLYLLDRHAQAHPRPAALGANRMLQGFRAPWVQS